MSYDLRLTVPEESEIKGLSTDEILSLFFFGKADLVITPPPIIVAEGGGKLRPVFFWKAAAGTPLSRPINTGGTYSAATKYTAIAEGKRLVFEGTFVDGSYVAEKAGQYLLFAAAQGNVADATVAGDIIMVLNDTTGCGNSMVMKDVSSWGGSGTAIDIVDLVPGDRIAFHSAYTTAVAGSWLQYKITMLILRWD